MSTSESDQKISASNRDNSETVVATGRLRNFGEGTLEFDGGVVRFFVEKGRFRKRRELVKEISVVDLEGLDRDGNELSFASGGATSYFVVEEAGLVDGLFGKINGAFESQQKVTAGFVGEKAPVESEGEVSVEAVPVESKAEVVVKELYVAPEEEVPVESKPETIIPAESKPQVPPESKPEEVGEAPLESKEEVAQVVSRAETVIEEERIEPKVETPVESKAQVVSAKAVFKGVGSGVLEFDGGVVRFFVEKGRFRKRRELVKEISVVDLEGLDRDGNELSVTSGGVPSYFVVEKAELVDGLFGKINGAFEENQKVAGAIEAKPESKMETEKKVEEEKPKKPVAVRLSIKVKAQDSGNGLLEFKDNFLRFYTEKGYLTKQKELKKEISIDEIESAKYEDNGLSVTVQGSPIVFVVQKGESAGPLFEKIEEALSEKQRIHKIEEEMKQEQQQLAKTIRAIENIADDLFDILIGLNGRIDWDNIKNHVKHAQESFDGLSREGLIKTDLDIGKIMLPVKGHKNDEISKEVFTSLKTLYDYVGGLQSKNHLADKLHPNYNDAQCAIRAYYTVNDVALGKVVRDQEIAAEINELVLMFVELSKQTGLTADVEALKVAMNKLEPGSINESSILECRSVFRQQLKQTANL